MEAHFKHFLLINVVLCNVVSLIYGDNNNNNNKGNFNSVKKSYCFICHPHSSMFVVKYVKVDIFAF